MYYMEFTDDEVKKLAGILGSFIGKNELNKDMKEFIESARDIFEKVIHAEETKEFEAENEQLEAQIEKMKNTRNCLTFYKFKCPLQEQSDDDNKAKSCRE